jgi:hypothetical protein
MSDQATNASAQPARRVRVINNGRDTIHVDYREGRRSSGKGKDPRPRKEFLLGSQDDKGVVKATQPEQVIDIDTWLQLSEAKVTGSDRLEPWANAIQGMVKSGQISVYPA